MRPRRAAEIAPDGILAAGSSGAESPLAATAFVPLREGMNAGLSAPIFSNREAVVAGLRDAMNSVDPHGRDWTLILPDACARVLLLEFDTLPQKQQEILPLVRFRLRRMLPFDADIAAVSYQVLNSTGKGNGSETIQVMAAAMPAEIRDEIESVVRDLDKEPGTLLPTTLAALAATPNSGVHLLAHTGERSVTTAITQDGQLLLYRRTEFSENDPGEIAQAILVSAAYYEDTLHKPLDELLVAGLETPESLRRRLSTDGDWRISLRSLVDRQAFTAEAVPGNISVCRFASVVGALQG